MVSILYSVVVSFHLDFICLCLVQQLQKLKAENERLKAENRALTRVVSKLTANAAQTTTSHSSYGK